VKRSSEKEMIDAGDNDPAVLAEDLRNLRQLNRYLRGRRCVMSALERVVRRERITRFSLLDIGTGSADIAAAILAWSHKSGKAVRIVGLETDPTTVRIAADRTRHLPAIRIVRGDAAAPPFLPGSFDFILASQLLHHFPEPMIVSLLVQWSKLARRAIIICDLIRHPVAYHGIRLLTSLTTRNIMTRTDAPLSVRRALTFEEWRDLFSSAAIGPTEIFPVFPFRMAACVNLQGR
jgi:SAM-dependent methyltransferase